MSYPGFTAEASMYRTSASYRGTSVVGMSGGSNTVIAKQMVTPSHTECGIGCPPPPPPRRCPSGQRCCEPDGQGGCLLCWPIGWPCP